MMTSETQPSANPLQKMPPGDDHGSLTAAAISDGAFSKTRVAKPSNHGAAPFAKDCEPLCPSCRYRQWSILLSL
jgi:hypothetical protein